ncbi:hypothetical protein [Oceanithermus sp.]|uniref:hypothetical protein n=1 Tax=Oceanithermus sp. TaxID=2268145 RepID=UPI00257E5ACD|nr:hypothetical protein [Oceanithermus sp.]
MGTGNLNPYELHEAGERRRSQVQKEMERLRAADPLLRRGRALAANLLKNAARRFLRAAERLEAGRYEEQASGA